MAYTILEEKERVGNGEEMRSLEDRGKSQGRARKGEGKESKNGIIKVIREDVRFLE